MSISKPMIAELTMEAANTQKMLERVPFAELGWKPHEKSMPLGRLATHVATTEELVAFHQKNIADAVEAMEKATDEDMMKPWTLRNGDHVIMTMPKVAVIRNVGMNHIIHHRAQLSTYLRQHNIPVPGMYGPSADEMN
jgi:hypothetical protein